MRKLLTAVLLACCVLMSGCELIGANMPEGFKRIKDAKAAYETLDSAHVTMIDLADNKQIMDFSFLINSQDEMVFSYYGIDGETEQFAYSDGAQYFYKTTGDERWHVIASSDENYAYNLYNRKWRYPYARGGIFFLDASSVSSAEITEHDDGSVSIGYDYDADKLNGSAVGYIEDVSSFSELSTTFEINPEGYITEFTERGSVTDTEGRQFDVNLKIIVSEMNEVSDIPYPVDAVYKE